MISPRFSVALALAFVGTQAFTSITAPSVVIAGAQFTISIDTGSGDSSFSSYRLYLDTTPPGYQGGPSCYLQNSTSISTTSVSVSIPADLGPSGDFYAVSTREFPSADSTTYTYSANFNLTGATGNWSQYENDLMGAPLWPADDLPCQSYACARACAMSSFPDDLTGGSNAQKTMTGCILKCPGVSQPISTTSSAIASSTGSKAGTAAKTSATGSSASTSASSSSKASVTSGTLATQTSGSEAAATSKGVASIERMSIQLLAVGGIFALVM